jgi:hypothetical protein
LFPHEFPLLLAGFAVTQVIEGTFLCPSQRWHHPTFLAECPNPTSANCFEQENLLHHFVAMHFLQLLGIEGLLVGISDINVDPDDT